MKKIQETEIENKNILVRLDLDVSFKSEWANGNNPKIIGYLGQEFLSGCANDLGWYFNFFPSQFFPSKQIHTRPFKWLPSIFYCTVCTVWSNTFACYAILTISTFR